MSRPPRSWLPRWTRLQSLRRRRRTTCTSLRELSLRLETLEDRRLLTSEISGQQWHDVDGDGVHDPGEPGLNGWTIELVVPGTDMVFASTTTDDIDLNGDGTIDPVTEASRYALYTFFSNRWAIPTHLTRFVAISTDRGW